MYLTAEQGVISKIDFVKVLYFAKLRIRQLYVCSYSLPENHLGMYPWSGSRAQVYLINYAGNVS